MSDTTNLPLQFFNLWLTLLLIWLIANGSLDSHIVISGLIITAVVAMLFATFSQVYSVIRWSPVVIYYYLLYLGIFLVELVKANIHVMRLVFSPKVNIHPGILEIKTNLKSSMGRLALANSITLTPGTLVIDIRDDSLFVHCIDIKSTDKIEATEEIAGRFENYLKVIYG